MLCRSPWLVAYWGGDGLRLRNYRTGDEVRAVRGHLEILEHAARPTPIDRLIAAGGADGEALVRELVTDAMLIDADTEQPLPEAWRAWLPEAGLFHFATKDYPFRDPAELFIVPPEPPPPPLKELRADGGACVGLPDFPRSGALPETLLARRTWRRFDDRPLTLQELATLTGLTWAVQMWATGIIDARLAFKTSPSGGARHSIEVYVAAARVEGLEPATYHYDPEGHRLQRVADQPTAQDLLRFLPTQAPFTEAAALFFMTSVFARVQFKYRFPRAYRVVLLEAGHLAQTFCLLATWLRLAPFSTAALGDTAIEDHLGIDGVSESVLYVTGVGARPQGLDWAPFGDERPAPATTPPEHRRRARD